MTGSDQPREADNPIWALLGFGEDSATRLWIVPARKPWQESLDAAISDVGPDERLIVSVPRPFARRVLSLLSGRGRGSGTGPSPDDVKGALTVRGMVVEATYGLWPSARSPRLAFPRSRLRMLLWAQRSGVLGGGGNRLWARALARSILFTPVAPVILPGLAFVARPGGTR